MIAFELDDGVDSEKNSSHGQAVGPKPVNRSAGPEPLPHPLATPPTSSDLIFGSSMGTTLNFGWPMDMELENWDCHQESVPDLLDAFMQATGGEYDDGCSSQVMNPLSSPASAPPMIIVSTALVSSSTNVTEPTWSMAPPTLEIPPNPISPSSTQLNTEPITRPEPITTSRELNTQSTMPAPKQMARAGSKVKKGAKRSENEAVAHHQARPKPRPIGRKSAKNAAEQPLTMGVPLPKSTNVPHPVHERKRKELGDRAYELRAEELKKKRARQEVK